MRTSTAIRRALGIGGVAAATIVAGTVFARAPFTDCLLYTSDAADDRTWVLMGGGGG